MTDPAAALLGRGGKGGVFYLHGADEFQKLQAVTALVNAHLDPATADFNLDRLRGRELDLEQLASILNTPPMMAEWRVVVVSETEGLAASSQRSSPTSSPRGRTRRSGRSVIPPEPTMGARARGAVAQAVGVDLGILNQELEKLSGYVEAGRPITRADVEAAGTSLPSQDRWGWIGLVGARRFKEALDSLRILMSQGESGVGLTISLATHMLRLAVLVDRGRGALEEALPGHQRWLAGKLMAETRGWSLPELVDAVDGLRVLDRQLKSSGASDEALLQTGLLERMAWRPR
ncbi:MAG: hypothetical protein P8188_08990 [Gemmatimonadota bacterium]